MNKIFLIEGPVGAGKSTLSYKLQEEHKAVYLALDDWMHELFSQDRPKQDLFVWYAERKKRCIHQIWKTTNTILNTGTDVILELGLITQIDRKTFFIKAMESPWEIDVYVVNTSKMTRKERVQKRNLEQGKTFSMVVPDEIFEFASNAWEPFTKEEATCYSVNYFNISG